MYHHLVLAAAAAKVRDEPPRVVGDGSARSILVASAALVLGGALLVDSLIIRKHSLVSRVRCT